MIAVPSGAVGLCGLSKSKKTDRACPRRSTGMADASIGKNTNVSISEGRLHAALKRGMAMSRSSAGSDQARKGRLVDA